MGFGLCTVAIEYDGGRVDGDSVVGVGIGGEVVVWKVIQWVAVFIFLEKCCFE